MRSKIFAVFTVVVLVVGGLSFALSRATVGDLSTPGEARRGLTAAASQLQLSGLVLERWLAAQATDPKLREPFNAGTRPARAEGATSVANQLRDAAGAAPELSGLSVGLVVLVDKAGIVLGRNGSALMRGDDLGAVYPALKEAIAKGITGSDAWVNRARNEQFLASYAPIRDAEGNVVGALAIGTAFNDERLTATSERTSGGILIAVIGQGEGLDIVAKSQGTPPSLTDALAASPAKEGITQAIGSGQRVDLSGLPEEFIASTAVLEGYGDGHRVVLVSATHMQGSSVVSSLFYSALGVIALGILLVAFGAYLLDVYISRPVSEMEDGLLAIMNGKTDLRFEIEHAELGGLVFRLNSMLNQLFGVQEDDTDDQGRPSYAPRSVDFQDALEVDERMAAMSSTDTADTVALRDEPAEAYYARIFREYIAAKTELGDPSDHITAEAFAARIRSSEKEMSDKHGKPVRYKVEVRGKEIVLLAVPLA